MFYLRILVFDQSSPVHLVSDTRWGSMSMMDGRTKEDKKNLCLMLDCHSSPPPPKPTGLGWVISLTPATGTTSWGTDHPHVCESRAVLNLTLKDYIYQKREFLSILKSVSSLQDMSQKY